MPKYTFVLFFLPDPFQDFVSEIVVGDDEATTVIDDTTETEITSTTTTTTATSITPSPTTTSTTTTLPKSCPAPDITYNGSLLTTSEAFKDIHDVEFEVKTGPFPGDRRRCKLSCVAGQWVGPLCRKDEGKQKHGIVNKIESKMRKLGDPYFFICKD